MLEVEDVNTILALEVIVLKIEVVLKLEIAVLEFEATEAVQDAG
jgi:hypothetical protein